jgi:tetratricopeptide (TPR) repeat protein
MARSSYVRLGVVAALALAADASAAQVTRRDSSRTTIIDSVRKTYGVPLSQIAGRPGSAAADLTRTVDAEVRVAMFELTSGETLPALSRLERLGSLVGQDSASGVAQPERAALHFLLAETYYRLGMLAAFRPEAEAAMAGGRTRYASVLQPQMLVEAYRSGDYARAASIAREMPASGAGGAALVAGLAAYQAGDLAAARAAFARAATGAGSFASYARYMDALAQLRGDTAHAASAVASLEAAAASATGGFADQARLTAAQVAYEGERYDDAIRIAGTIGDASALAAPALFTRAWALYKVNRVDDAEKAFSDFVSRYPRRPEHDEAQLMAAQAQLELGRSTEAERVFQAVADSSAANVSMLQAQTNAAIGEVARALVANRSADLLATGDPAGSKAVVLEDSTAVTGALAALGAESQPAGTGAQVSVVATSVSARLDSIASRAPAMVTRVLFAPPSATRQPRELVGRSQALAAADAAVAVARHRLGEELEGQQREIALLTRLAAALGADSAGIGSLAADFATLGDSMARLDQLMAAAEARLRQLLGREIEATRTLAAENARAADSLRTALGAGAGPDDRAAIDAEVAAATSYARIAELAASGLDRAIARHPAFAARDSVRAHNAKARTMLADLQSSYAGSRRDVDAALAALRNGDAPAVQRARQALTDAESRRGAVENEVIAAVTAELSARAAEMVASLQRSTEAAQFGVASAAFFRAIDGTRALGGAGTVGAARSPAPDRRR